MQDRGGIYLHMQHYVAMSVRIDPAAESFACTCARVRKAARRITQIYDRHIQPAGLTVTQFGILANLTRLDGIAIGALAERMIMDPTALTRGLKPLERQGFVRLEPDPNDRRARRILLTAAGRAALSEARPGWARAQAEVRAALGADATAALHQSIDFTLERLA
ncbi:MarR family winged helix-turn-helix transcriptional regulator [Phreatobacter sp.]|uniref:MarR family winged helix-turn-helix transcriptional regulator n=1 Tax=Phreatobacter sp. TaxID=1966341 RepID=UPI003F6EFA37